MGIYGYKSGKNIPLELNVRKIGDVVDKMYKLVNVGFSNSQKLPEDAMPRGAGLNAPGTLPHVIVRGIERRKIVNDDQDRDHFVSRLGTFI